jgi:hypothetical protein
VEKYYPLFLLATLTGIHMMPQNGRPVRGIVVGKPEPAGGG